MWQWAMFWSCFEFDTCGAESGDLKGTGGGRFYNIYKNLLPKLLPKKFLYYPWLNEHNSFLFTTEESLEIIINP